MKLILNHPPSLSSLSIHTPKTNHFSSQPQLLNPPTPNQTPILGHLGPRVVGSCQGLLCLNYPECGLLWNPSTKTHYQMPEPEEEVFDSDERKRCRFYVLHGLGYDEINDDYKVIRVYQYSGQANGVQKFESKVLVYSLKENSWIRVGDFPYFVHFGAMCDVFVNGALHFKASTKRVSVGGDDTVDSDCLIVAFDVSSYTYKVITRLTFGELKYDVALGVLGERLCMIRNYDVGISQCLVMKEYGVNSSWTELFRVKMDAGLRLRPISYLGDEKQVLLEGGGEIFCFDVESKSFNDFEIDGLDEEDFEVCVCTESKVVLDSVDGNDKTQQQVKEEVNEESLETEVVLRSVDDSKEIEVLHE